MGMATIIRFSVSGWTDISANPSRLWFARFRAFSAKLNMPESPSRQKRVRMNPFGGHLMFDTATTALLRAVLDEVCESVSHRETGARTHVASKILEAATRGEVSRPMALGRSAATPCPVHPRCGADPEGR